MVQSTPDADFSAEKYGESQGVKDYKKYTQSFFRKSTDAELNGQGPENAIIGPFIDYSGPYSIFALTSWASMTDAALVDMQDGDAGTPIYVRTKRSYPQSVSCSEDQVPYVTTDSDGNTSYSYSGTTEGRMNVRSYDGSGAIVENNNYTGAYTVNYKVSSATKYTSTLYSKASDGSYYVNNQTFYTGYKKSTLTVTGTDTGSGSAKLEFTPLNRNWSSGVVTVTPYTAERVVAKKLVPARLTQAQAIELKFDYYTYIPSIAKTETKTFLMNG